MGMTAARSVPTTKSLVLHRAFLYDLLLWFLSFGKESKMREKALRLVRLSGGENVLDIGCGTGTVAIMAKRQVGEKGHVCGIDASPQMLARAGKKARKAGLELDFRNASVESMPFPDGHFDVVLSSMMLHHLPSKLRQQCAVEVRRVLKPGGRLLAVDFGTAPGKKGIVAHFHRHGHINLAEMVTVFKEAGLNIANSGAVGIGDLEYVIAVAPGRELSPHVPIVDGNHASI